MEAELWMSWQSLKLYKILYLKYFTSTPSLSPKQHVIFETHDICLHLYPYLPPSQPEKNSPARIPQTNLHPYLNLSQIPTALSLATFPRSTSSHPL